MAMAYGQTVHPRTFTEGQLVLRATEHVRKNILRPFEFAPKLGRALHHQRSPYYYLVKEDATAFADPINGKWLK